MQSDKTFKKKKLKGLTSAEASKIVNQISEKHPQLNLQELLAHIEKENLKELSTSPQAHHMVLNPQEPHTVLLKMLNKLNMFGLVDCMAEESKIANACNDEEEEKEDDTSYGDDKDDTKSVKKVNCNQLEKAGSPNEKFNGIDNNNNNKDSNNNNNEIITKENVRGTDAIVSSKEDINGCIVNDKERLINDFKSELFNTKSPLMNAMPLNVVTSASLPATAASTISHVYTTSIFTLNSSTFSSVCSFSSSSHLSLPSSSLTLHKRKKATNSTQILNQYKKRRKKRNTNHISNLLSSHSSKSLKALHGDSSLQQSYSSSDSSACSKTIISSYLISSQASLNKTNQSITSKECSSISLKERTKTIKRLSAIASGMQSTANTIDTISVLDSTLEQKKIQNTDNSKDNIVDANKNKEILCSSYDAEKDPETKTYECSSDSVISFSSSSPSSSPIITFSSSPISSSLQPSSTSSLSNSPTLSNSLSSSCIRNLKSSDSSHAKVFLNNKATNNSCEGYNGAKSSKSSLRVNRSENSFVSSAVYTKTRKRANKMAVAKSRQCNVDLKSPNSILTSINLKNLLNKHTFGLLPSSSQELLCSCLPLCDRISADGSIRVNNTALSNEFFTKACMEWKERLQEGEFTNENKRKHDEPKDAVNKQDPWKAKHFENDWGDKLNSIEEKEDDNKDEARDTASHTSTCSTPNNHQTLNAPISSNLRSSSRLKALSLTNGSNKSALKNNVTTHTNKYSDVIRRKNKDKLISFNSSVSSSFSSSSYSSTSSSYSFSSSSSSSPSSHSDASTLTSLPCATAVSNTSVSKLDSDCKKTQDEELVNALQNIIEKESLGDKNNNGKSRLPKTSSTVKNEVVAESNDETKNIDALPHPNSNGPKADGDESTGNASKGIKNKKNSTPLTTSPSSPSTNKRSRTCYNDRSEEEDVKKRKVRTSVRHGRSLKSDELKTSVTPQKPLNTSPKQTPITTPKSAKKTTDVDVSPKHATSMPPHSSPPNMLVSSSHILKNIPNKQYTTTTTTSTTCPNKSMPSISNNVFLNRFPLQTQTKVSGRSQTRTLAQIKAQNQARRTAKILLNNQAKESSTQSLNSSNNSILSSPLHCAQSNLKKPPIKQSGPQSPSSQLSSDILLHNLNQTKVLSSSHLSNITACTLQSSMKQSFHNQTSVSNVAATFSIDSNIIAETSYHSKLTDNVIKPSTKSSTSPKNLQSATPSTCHNIPLYTTSLLGVSDSVKEDQVVKDGSEAKNKSSPIKKNEESDDGCEIKNIINSVSFVGSHTNTKDLLNTKKNILSVEDPVGNTFTKGDKLLEKENSYSAVYENSTRKLSKGLLKCKNFKGKNLTKTDEEKKKLKQKIGYEFDDEENDSHDEYLYDDDDDEQLNDNLNEYKSVGKSSQSLSSIHKVEGETESFKNESFKKPLNLNQKSTDKTPISKVSSHNIQPSSIPKSSTPPQKLSMSSAKSTPSFTTKVTTSFPKHKLKIVRVASPSGQITYKVETCIVPPSPNNDSLNFGEDISKCAIVNDPSDKITIKDNEEDLKIENTTSVPSSELNSQSDAFISKQIDHKHNPSKLLDASSSAPNLSGLYHTNEFKNPLVDSGTLKCLTNDKHNRLDENDEENKSTYSFNNSMLNVHDSYEKKYHVDKLKEEVLHDVKNDEKTVIFDSKLKVLTNDSKLNESKKINFDDKKTSLNTQLNDTKGNFPSLTPSVFEESVQRSHKSGRHAINSNRSWKQSKKQTKSNTISSYLEQQKKSFNNENKDADIMKNSLLSRASSKSFKNHSNFYSFNHHNSAPHKPFKTDATCDKGDGCMCNLKAFVICSKCGAYCHNDCIGSSQICITCLISA